MTVVGDEGPRGEISCSRPYPTLRYDTTKVASPRTFFASAAAPRAQGFMCFCGEGHPVSDIRYPNSSIPRKLLYRLEGRLSAD